jgi:hypothetical protein
MPLWCWAVQDVWAPRRCRMRSCLCGMRKVTESPFAPAHSSSGPLWDERHVWCCRGLPLGALCVSCGARIQGF